MGGNRLERAAAGEQQARAGVRQSLCEGALRLGGGIAERHHDGSSVELRHRLCRERAAVAQRVSQDSHVRVPALECCTPGFGHCRRQHTG